MSLTLFRPTKRVEKTEGSDKVLQVGIPRKQTENVMIVQEVYLRNILRINMYKKKGDGAELNKGTVRL